MRPVRKAHKFENCAQASPVQTLKAVVNASCEVQSLFLGSVTGEINTALLQVE
jgi:hypothetical protein